MSQAPVGFRRKPEPVPRTQVLSYGRELGACARRALSRARARAEGSRCSASLLCVLIVISYVYVCMYQCPCCCCAVSVTVGCAGGLQMFSCVPMGSPNSWSCAAPTLTKYGSLRCMTHARIILECSTAYVSSIDYMNDNVCPIHNSAGFVRFKLCLTCGLSICLLAHPMNDIGTHRALYRVHIGCTSVLCQLSCDSA